MVQLLEVLLVALAVPVVLVAMVAAGVFILRKVREHRGAATELEVQVGFGTWVGDVIDDLNGPSAPCSSDSRADCTQEPDSPQHTAQPDAGISAD
jgi:hypothetical protein